MVNVHVKAKKRKTKNKSIQKNEANESATEPVILRYHASENDRANCDVEILNGETSSHYSGPQFHNMPSGDISASSGCPR